MTEKMEGFLIDVSSNPDQLARFNSNPGDVVAKSDLTESERASVLSRDSSQVSDALGSTGFALGLGVEIITPAKAPAKRKAPAKGPAKKKTPPRKKTPARKKAPAKKKAPATRKSPARKKAPARKRAPAKRAPAKRAPARKSSRRATSRKKR
jgi:hypothetical protein